MIKLIAETAWHHEGDFAFMQKLVSDICNEESVDIVKLHITLDIDEYMSHENELYETLNKWLFNSDQWEKIINIIRNKNKKLMILCNDTQAIKFASSFSPEYVELHALCMNVPALQNQILEMLNENIKIVVGVGGSTLEEIDYALKKFSNRKIVLMTGFQNYPTKYEDVNLKKIRKIREMYREKEIGYADHTAWNENNNELITLAVAANGMDYIEKHVTNSYGTERCDSSAAISIEMVKELKKKLMVLEQIPGDGSMKLNQGEMKYASIKMVGFASKDLKKGQILNEKDINFTRSSKKSDIDQITLIKNFGREIKKDIKKDSLIRLKDFQD